MKKLFISITVSLMTLISLYASTFEKTKSEHIQSWFDDFDNHDNNENKGWSADLYLHDHHLCTPTVDPKYMVDHYEDFINDMEPLVYLSWYIGKSTWYYHSDLKSKCNESYSKLKQAYESMMENAIDDEEFKKLESIYKSEKIIIENTIQNIKDNIDNAIKQKKEKMKSNSEKGLGIIFKPE